MQKRFLTIVVALTLCLCVGSATLAEAWTNNAVITPMQATGGCWLSPSGRNVTYGGSSLSASIEDQISVSVCLLEYRNGTWCQVGPGIGKMNYNSDYASASTTYKVTGGYYYKVSAVHTSKTGSYSYSGTSETSAVWIS